MKALSIRQPWTSALMRTDPARKSVENRNWATKARGRIAIHASAIVDRRALAVVPDPNTRDLGVILGTVQVVDCHKQDSAACLARRCREDHWAQFSDNPRKPMWHWVLENPRSFVTPIHAKGALQLWEPNPSVAYLIEIGEYQ